jgi:hypothetical protein
LYEYIDENLIRYFYNKEDSDIEQLVFKRYKNAKDEIATNDGFRQQLWNTLKCPSFKVSN